MKQAPQAGQGRKRASNLSTDTRVEQSARSLGRAAVTGLGVSIPEEVLTNFDTAQSVDTSVVPESYTLTTAGTVDSSQLSGSITYTTPVTFQGSGEGYPFAGELLITGAGGATIRLVTLDAINVRIETDTDGDGTVDATEDTTWDDIALTP